MRAYAGHAERFYNKTKKGREPACKNKTEYLAVTVKRK